MNRKKKVKQTLLSKAKKANAKKNPSNKPRYISKAERAKLEAEAEADQSQVEVAAEQEASKDSAQAE